MVFRTISARGEKMRRILIKKEFAQDRISRAAGERLRLQILEAAQKNQTVEIDFKDTVIASTSFFDESIAKLAEEGWDDAKLGELVKLVGLHRLDLKVLDQVCKYRGLDIRLAIKG